MSSEYVYPERYVHLTRKNLGKRVRLRPSKSYRPMGVAFAPTVRNALEGIPFYYTDKNDWKSRRKLVKEGNEFNVYTPTRKRKAIIPKTIDDFERTRERRVTSGVKAKLMGRIRVKVANNKWSYKWLR